MSASAEIVSLGAPVTDGALTQRADVLVEGGASVSFMAPFSHHSALAFFRKVARLGRRGRYGVAGRRARGADRRHGPARTGYAVQAAAPTSRSCWCTARYAAAALMTAVEAEARRHGRWLLVLGTVPGENGHRRYQSAGWTQTGIVPDYAMFPDGRLCDTAIMWKRLER